MGNLGLLGDFRRMDQQEVPQLDLGTAGLAPGLICAWNKQASPVLSLWIFQDGFDAINRKTRMQYASL